MSSLIAIITHKNIFATEAHGITRKNKISQLISNMYHMMERLSMHEKKPVAPDARGITSEKDWISNKLYC